MFVHLHPARVRGPFRTAATLSLLLVAGAAFAQTPLAAAAPAAENAEIQQAYSGLDWTGRPLSPATIRQEAAAARVEGRRSCARSFTGDERKSCLQTVEQDHQAMLARLKMRTARR